MLKLPRSTIKISRKSLFLGVPFLSIYLIILILNSLTGYRGISLLPGVRMLYKHLFINTAFIPQNTIEYQLGMFVTEILLFYSIFRLIQELLKHLNWRLCLNLFLTLSLTISINFIFSKIQF